MGNTGASQPLHRTAYNLDLSQDMDNLIRSVHRTLLRMDDHARHVEETLQQMRLTVDYLSTEMSRLRRDQRRMSKRVSIPEAGSAWQDVANTTDVLKPQSNVAATGAGADSFH